MARDFLSDHGVAGQRAGTLFILESQDARQLRTVSMIPGEEEVLFTLNSQFRVIKQLSGGAVLLLEQAMEVDLSRTDVYELRQVDLRTAQGIRDALTKEEQIAMGPLIRELSRRPTWKAADLGPIRLYSIAMQHIGQHPQVRMGWLWSAVFRAPAKVCGLLDAAGGCRGFCRRSQGVAGGRVLYGVVEGCRGLWGYAGGHRRLQGAVEGCKELQDVVGSCRGLYGAVCSSCVLKTGLKIPAPSVILFSLRKILFFLSGSGTQGLESPPPPLRKIQCLRANLFQSAAGRLCQKGSAAHRLHSRPAADCVISLHCLICKCTCICVL